MNRKKLILLILGLATLVGIVSAATIPYFGQVQMTAKVKQAVLLDGKNYTTPITEEVEVAGGESFCRHHWLKSQTSVPVDLKFTTNYIPEGAGITTTYLLLEPSWTTTAHQSGGTDGFDVAISFSMSDDSFTWTFDADMEDPDAQSNLNTVGNSVNLQLDGDDSDNWFYVLYADGSYMKVEYWTWDWLEQGNITDLGVSVNAETEGHVVWTIPNSLAADGTIKMMGSQPFGYDFLPPEGTVYTGIGYLPSEPTPITEITLGPGERLDFLICYEFAPDIQAGKYVITTTVELAP